MAMFAAGGATVRASETERARESRDRARDRARERDKEGSTVAPWILVREREDPSSPRERDGRAPTAASGLSQAELELVV